MTNEDYAECTSVEMATFKTIRDGADDKRKGSLGFHKYYTNKHNTSR